MRRADTLRGIAQTPKTVMINHAATHLCGKHLISHGQSWAFSRDSFKKVSLV